MKLNWKKYNDDDLEAGTYVFTEDGDIKVIGHLNAKLGVCGCCDEYIKYYCDDHVGFFNEKLFQIEQSDLDDLIDGKI